MVIEYLDKKDQAFPEGKIITLDGRMLECYPVAKTDIKIADDKIKLDTTGRFLAVGKRPKTVSSASKSQEEQHDLFVNNAFYLLAHRERIMSDSRMFLCPVAINSGLAYVGSSGFSRPTLGVYLEWWAAAADAMQTDKKGRRILVYHIAGSPLSGANHCAAIRDDGKRKMVTLYPFSDYWQSFIKINHRYKEAKHAYQAYGLQEVLDILHEEDNGNTDFARTIETMYMTHEIDRLNCLVEAITKSCNEWKNRYDEISAKYLEKRMLNYYEKYEEALNSANTLIESLEEQKKALKAELKSGKMDSLVYQRVIMPLNERIIEIKREVRSYKYNKVREAFADNASITFYDIEQSVKAQRSQEDAK